MNKFAIEQAKATLVELVTQRVAENPHERGGKAWGVFRQDALAKALSTSERTIYTWTGKPPFQREVARIDGETRTLLRLLAEGETATKTPQYVANLMRKVWAEKVGTKLDSRQHGCLIGLAKVWPEGHQLAIFKAVLNDWPGFMTISKMDMLEWAAKNGYKLKGDTPLEQSYLAKLGLGPDPKTLPEAEGLEIRYLKYPSITYMRAFYWVGVALYELKLQSGDIKGVEKVFPLPKFYK